MLEKLIGDLGSKSNVEVMFSWRWAEAHPYLYTLIKISDSFLYLAVAYAGYYIIKKIIKKESK